MKKEEITKLTDREIEDLIPMLEKELSERRIKALKEKQEKCKHNFVYVGGDYGHDECTLCGKWK